MGNLPGSCPSCPVCSERPCYPQVNVHIGIIIVILLIIAVSILVGIICNRYGQWKAFKRGFKKGEEVERRRSQDAEYVATQKAAGVANMLALHALRGANLTVKTDAGFDGENIGEGTGQQQQTGGATGMFLVDNNRRSFQTIQHQIPQSPIILPHIKPPHFAEQLMSPTVTTIQSTPTRGNIKRLTGDTIII